MDWSMQIDFDPALVASRNSSFKVSSLEDKLIDSGSVDKNSSETKNSS